MVVKRDLVVQTVPYATKIAFGLFELQPQAESAFKSNINGISVTNPLISLIEEVSAYLAPESVTNFQI